MVRVVVQSIGRSVNRSSIAAWAIISLKIFFGLFQSTRICSFVCRPAPVNLERRAPIYTEKAYKARESHKYPNPSNEDQRKKKAESNTRSFIFEDVLSELHNSRTREKGSMCKSRKWSRRGKGEGSLEPY